MSTRKTIPVRALLMKCRACGCENSLDEAEISQEWIGVGGVLSCPECGSEDFAIMLLDNMHAVLGLNSNPDKIILDPGMEANLE